MAMTSVRTSRVPKLLDSSEIPRSLHPQRLSDEMEKFTSAVKRSKGKVIVLVHPFFQYNERNGRVSKDYELELKKLAERVASGKTAPVVVLEHIFDMDETHRSIGSEHTYFVPTEDANPTPWRGSWDDVHSAFKKAGVKNVLIAGMNTFTKEQSLKVDLPDELAESHEAKLPIARACISRGCAGETYKQFIWHMQQKPPGSTYKKVQFLPSLCYPTKPLPKGFTPSRRINLR